MPRKPGFRFYFHFNKPASQSAKAVKVSVHVDDRCHIVDNVVCLVPSYGKVRPRQPRFVMVGRCMAYEIEHGVMTLR